METMSDLAFGGGDIDRAACARGDDATLERMLDEDTAGVILLWRGKPLVSEVDGVSLVRLATRNALVAKSDPLIFLGRDGGDAVFAADLKDWEPEDVDFSTLGAFLDPTCQRHPDLPEDQFFAELRAVMTQLAPNDAELVATAKALFGWHDSHGFCAKCGARSEVIKAGWQRSCPTCGRQHFPRTDPVVIMLITNGNNVLLGRSPGWPEGMYSLLAGFVEPGETVEAAVRREVAEETNVMVGPVSYIASQPWPFPTSLMIGCSGLAQTDEITVDTTELEAARWVSREDLAQAFAGLHPEIKPARKGAIAHFILRNWLAGHVV